MVLCFVDMLDLNQRILNNFWGCAKVFNMKFEHSYTLVALDRKKLHPDCTPTAEQYYEGPQCSSSISICSAMRSA